MNLRKHKVSLAIILFLVLFMGVHYTKPLFIYDADGGFRPFGVGFKHKTVLPIWIIVIIIAILSYISVSAMIQFMP